MIPTIMETLWAISSGDFFRSFEAPETSGVHYGFSFFERDFILICLVLFSRLPF